MSNDVQIVYVLVLQDTIHGVYATKALAEKARKVITDKVAFLGSRLYINEQPVFTVYDTKVKS